MLRVGVFLKCGEICDWFVIGRNVDSVFPGPWLRDDFLTNDTFLRPARKLGSHRCLVKNGKTTI